MAMTKLGNGRKESGYYTGLSIAQEFANAVCHFLRDHSMARPHEGGGKELPLDEKVWDDVLKLEYDPQAQTNAQSLKDYCEKYYNAGQKGSRLQSRWNMGLPRYEQTPNKAKGAISQWHG